MQNISKFKRIKFIKTDLAKNKKWEKYLKGVDCVFHLAALSDIIPSIENPRDYFDSNVVGSLNLMEACRKYKIKKIVYSASSSSYGIPKKFPTSESEKIVPLYPYAFTKFLGEQVCLHWGRIYKIDVISLRLFNVYGTRSRTNGNYGAMFGTFLSQKLNNKPYTIVGDGKQSRDFTYVSDVVNAFILASKSKFKNEIFNVGSGKHVKVKEIVKILKGSVIRIPKRPGEPDITFANISKIKKHLKWKPRINIKDGISYLLKDLKYWEKAPLWTPVKIKKATKSWFRYLK